ncbi:MAG TPA: SDR family oxidoreductase [Vicinamibacterales bacterium]|nr:SDR family oxidoreductase [Vicinamibacterales bacterium]
MTGKTCIVTGANSGIGKETALGLARMGAFVVLVCRNEEKGRQALEDIRRETGSSQLDLQIADMSSFESVRALAAQVHQQYRRLDVLINNAGTAIVRRALSADGIEMTVAGNHLGPALLTLLLLDLLKSSAPSRVVNVSSEAHRGARFDLNSLQSAPRNEGPPRRGFGPPPSLKAYGLSKLMMNAFTFELARRLQGSGVTVNCLHPGVVATNIWPADAPLIFRMIMAVAKPFMLTPKRGAQTSLYLATSPEVATVSGQYFIKSKRAESSPLSRDPKVIADIWQWTEKTVGVTLPSSAPPR